MKIFFFSVIFFLLSSCKSQKLDILEIDFEADACYGTCPVFTMTINQNGTANYDAKMFNERQGQFTTVIKNSQLDSLTQLFQESNLISLKNEYSTNWTDHPTYILTVKFKNGQIKKVSDYGPSGPDKLKKIYHFIFSLRQTQDWK